MNLQSFGVSWVDFVVLLVLGFGIWRGRKRGMSEECVDIVKWFVTVLAAGLLYRPLGQLLHETAGVFGLLGSYITAYLLVLLLVAIVFSYIRRGVGDKLIGSDVFGSGEYYLGMLSGMGRYTCILIVAFAFLHARYFSPEELKANEKYQLDNFGSNFFITLPDLQREVFSQSIAGRCVKEFLGFVLIESTTPGAGAPAINAKARERSIYDVLDKK